MLTALAASGCGRPAGSPAREGAALAQRPGGQLAATTPAPQPVVRTFTLAPGPGTARQLAGGQIDAYEIDLQADQYLQATFDQQGVDLVVNVFAPGHRRLFRIDSPNGDQGPEQVHLIAEEAGRYRLEISTTLGSPRGLYVPGRLALALPSRRERSQAGADRAFYEAREIDGQPDRFWEAAAKYERGIFLFQEAGDRWHQAYALFRLGRLQRVRPREALDSFERAAGLFQTLRDRHFEAAALDELGTCHQDLADFERASHAYRRALELARRPGEEKQQATILHNLGNLSQLQGRPWQALVFFREALGLCRRLAGEEARILEANTQTGIGWAYSSTGDWQRAIDAHWRALELRNRLRDLRLRSISLTQIGSAWLKTDPQRALPFLERARKLQRGVQSPKDQASTLDALGVAFRLLGRHGQAQAAYGQALDLFTSLRDLQGQAVTRINLGWTAIALNQPAEALRSFEQGLLLARQVHNPATEAGALEGMAEAERRRGNFTQAQRRAEDSLQIVESLRSILPGADLRTSYLAAQGGVYGVLVRTLMDQHRQRPGSGFDLQALARSEQSRARALLDALRESRRRGSDRAEPLPTVETQRHRLLDRETLLLEYFLGSNQGYFWAVSSEGVQSFELPGLEVLEPLLRSAREQLAASPAASGDPAGEARLLELSRLFLGPVASQLRGKRLLIAADGIQQYIPFAALPDPTGRQEPLILHHEIVAVPSLGVLAELRGRADRRPPPEDLAIVADPVFDASDERLARAGTGRAQAAGAPEDVFLPRLAFARDEAHAIAALLPPGRVFQALDFAASRNLVTSGRLARYRILHFATHALQRTDQPELSALVLSRFGAQGQPLDGSLRVHDLEGLDLPADLVVLSACDTALGREVSGEGLVGLPQAFLTAGARRVLVSLWQVEEESTATLMTRFYRGLLTDHLPAAKALQEAQLAIRAEPRWRAPRYWAGFVLVGDWR